MAKKVTKKAGSKRNSSKKPCKTPAGIKSISFTQSYTIDLKAPTETPAFLKQPVHFITWLNGPPTCLTCRDKPCPCLTGRPYDSDKPCSSEPQ